ncbi:MAG: cytochrome C oxidase subunit IV family protein [Chloroflexota bacterium]
MAASLPIETNHPNASKYVRIGILLCAFTAVEVVVYYVAAIRDANLLAPILIALSAIKFVTVVGYYMHLKFDARVFTGLLGAGLVLAITLILTVTALSGDLLQSGKPFNTYTTQLFGTAPGQFKPAAQAQGAAASPKPGTKPMAVIDPSSIGDVGVGKELFVGRGCSGCHMAPGVPGNAQVGPNQAGYAERPTIVGGLLRNTPANTEKWIHNPKAIKPSTLMPDLGLSNTEVRDLTAFLYSLK